MELLSHKLTAFLEERVDWARPSTSQLVRRRASITGQGDMTRLLEHPGSEMIWSSERTEVARVMTRLGQPWAPDREAEILLLGDSFTNIYSDNSLGWGTASGLAEQLSFELGRGVDRIAINAGGSWSSRQALARGTVAPSGANRLAGKRVVVYQFATRELSTGDWKILEIPPPAGH
jgi:alginate O-acetyltransferase complex protein AlgJ